MITMETNSMVRLKAEPVWVKKKKTTNGILKNSRFFYGIAYDKPKIE